MAHFISGFSQVDNNVVTFLNVKQLNFDIYNLILEKFLILLFLNFNSFYLNRILILI